MQEQSGKRVMVFGVFDGCDNAHQYFLREASEFGSELIVVVARDEAVHELKKKCTFYKLDRRIADVEALGFADKVVPGDEKQYSWQVLKEYKPDVVVFGYDQTGLQEALAENFNTETHVIDKYTNK